MPCTPRLCKALKAGLWRLIRPVQLAQSAQRRSEVLTLASRSTAAPPLELLPWLESAAGVSSFAKHPHRRCLSRY